MQHIKIKNDLGIELDSNLIVSKVQSYYSIVFESRGGNKTTENARNPDYLLALDITLDRLKNMGCRIIDTRLASKIVDHLSEQERSLDLASFHYPIMLADLTIITELSSDIKNAMKIKASNSKSGGGNTTKRIEIIVASELSGLAFQFCLINGFEH
jgi:hypothetical protein